MEHIWTKQMLYKLRAPPDQRELYARWNFAKPSDNFQPRCLWCQGEGHYSAKECPFYERLAFLEGANVGPIVYRCVSPEHCVALKGWRATVEMAGYSVDSVVWHKSPVLLPRNSHFSLSVRDHVSFGNVKQASACFSVSRCSLMSFFWAARIQNADRITCQYKYRTVPCLRSHDEITNSESEACIALMREDRLQVRADLSLAVGRRTHGILHGSREDALAKDSGEVLITKADAGAVVRVWTLRQILAFGLSKRFLATSSHTEDYWIQQRWQEVEDWIRLRRPQPPWLPL